MGLRAPPDQRLFLGAWRIGLRLLNLLCCGELLCNIMSAARKSTAGSSVLGNVEDVRRPLDLKQVKRGYGGGREYNYWVPEVDVEGTIPAELQGTLFRNGPGLLEVYGKKLIHRKSFGMTSEKPHWYSKQCDKFYCKSLYIVILTYIVIVNPVH